MHCVKLINVEQPDLLKFSVKKVDTPYSDTNPSVARYWNEALDYII